MGSANSRHPRIIQGGMGIGVSGWELARSVAATGQLGVVSGTALEVVLARRLQLGDPKGRIRRALAEFPFPEMARRVLDAYHVPGGKAEHDAFRPVPLYTIKPSPALLELSMVAAFAEVRLAREGHGGPVGINYLCKIPLPLLSSMYGAILAGVDYVIAGAGNPEQIPALLSRLAKHDDVSLGLHVQYAGTGDRWDAEFSPRSLSSRALSELPRPRMLAIVASVDLATALSEQRGEVPDGFIVEGYTAGGHNAPPRGPVRLDPSGQPQYGPLDEVDLSGFRRLGLPFWLAGSYGSRDGLLRALDAGATGIQVGTAFAFCRESSLTLDVKRGAVRRVLAHQARIFTDPRASPTGFPFKVVELPGTLSDPDVYERRTRVCDLGCLRVPYQTAQGSIGYRCPSEPEAVYARKAGRAQNTAGRKCLCNALLANIGLGQVRNGHVELPLVTAGDDLVNLARHLPLSDDLYSASDVVRVLLGTESELPVSSASAEAWGSRSLRAEA
jgi:NAD(P)H-dependent flavin oxidoreductase YrpB (nitropropane dioxygenase family)